MNAELAAMRAEMATKADIAALRAEMVTKHEIATFRNELLAALSEHKADLLKCVAGVLLIQGGIVVILMKLLPGH